MISATEARELFKIPVYPLAQVEEDITVAARTKDYTCFATNRWTDELTGQLKALGYDVSFSSIGDVIVSWKQAA